MSIRSFALITGEATRGIGEVCRNVFGFGAIWQWAVACNALALYLVLRGSYLALERVFLTQIPQRRMLDPVEIATMARYLASEEARGITGQAINVSAGLIMH